MARGPEYADQLTATERRLLDTLLAERERQAASPRRSWRAPVAAGLAALVILSAATVAGQLGDPVPPPPAATGDPAPQETLAALATAAGRVPDPPEPTKGWYRHQLYVIIDGEPAPCQVAAVTTQVWEDVAPRPDDRIIGRLLAEAANPIGPGTARGYRPDPATGWPGCTDPVVATPDPAVFESDGDMSAAREKLGNWLGITAPRYTDSRPQEYLLIGADQHRPIEALKDLWAGSAPAGEWWAGLVALVTSPLARNAVRSEALRAAASRSDVVAVPEVTGDQTGRPGVSLRVPYGDRAAAELTFDPETGALLQRVVYSETDVEITAYLAARRR